MKPKEKLVLAYEVTKRMKLLPFLNEEKDAVLFCLDLVKEEDLK